jgi:2'-5' RNA ligase
MINIRRQLTLFISPNHETIEEIRAKFNLIQYRLIAAHITLCRGDEIEQVDKVIANLKAIQLDQPIRIGFDEPERFDNGNGVLIPAKAINSQFDELRNAVLTNVIDSPRKQLAHITLMHPRNSVCTDAIFNQIKNYNLPSSLSFDTISLIEQLNDGQWKIVEQYSTI